jgi:hypothetical protein
MRKFWLSALLLIGGLFLGLTMCFLGPSTLRRVFPPDNTKAVELTRAVSPDGRFDAVLVRDEWGGAMGGFIWAVFIVPKGEKLPSVYDKSIFVAHRLTRAGIVWKQPHLIEISYDKAEIERFQNVWSCWDDRQSEAERKNYYVEIRLAPFAPDYSILTPAGNLRLHP